MNLFAKICALPVTAALLSQAALAAPLSVEINKTIPVHLRSAASSVVLGNQKIADVAVHDEQLIFITGKMFGTTNLLIFDDAGRQIFSSDIVVVANEANLVTINRSGTNFTYDCAPNCQSTLSVGDDPNHFEQYIEQQAGAQSLSGGN